MALGHVNLPMKEAAPRRAFSENRESKSGNKVFYVMKATEKSLRAPEEWSEQEKEAIWEKGTPVESLDPDEYRMDAAGALIRRDACNQKHRFGWRIDGIVPANGDVDLALLRPLFWKNHEARRQEAPRKFYRYQSALELNVNHFIADDI